MVAGGSGITPMFQVASAILRDPRDATKVFLVYANVAEGDILLREQLDAWAAIERARFQVGRAAGPGKAAGCMLHACGKASHAPACWLAKEGPSSCESACMPSVGACSSLARAFVHGTGVLCPGEAAGGLDDGRGLRE
jgi:hypothetical protein